MWPAFVGIVGTVFGIMAWAVHENGGSPGNLISPTVKLSASARGFRFVQCISGIAGTYGGSGDRISDVSNHLFFCGPPPMPLEARELNLLPVLITFFLQWTRFSKHKNSHIIGSATAMPIGITLCALLGTLTASATHAKFGTTMWQPLTILSFVQNRSYTAGCRAATFFAGFAILQHQIFVNVTQNNVGAGMDLAGVWPKYVSMKRGSVFVCLCGIICQPWRFLTQATIFITIIGGFGGKFNSPANLVRIQTNEISSVHFGNYRDSYIRLLGCAQEKVGSS